MTVDLGSKPPALRALRTAVDWLNLFVDTPCPGWSKIREADSLLLDLPGGELSLERTSGRGRLDSGNAIFSGHGLRVALTDPERADRSRGVYHGAISVQGLACSTAHDGLAAVDRLVAAIQSTVWGDESELRTVPGRVDVCTDVEVCTDADAAVAWWDREVYAFGNLDDACSLFSTRARPKRKKLASSGGSAVTGARLVGDRRARTLYVGRDPQLRIYPKSRDPQRDTALVKQRWEEAGWQGETEVLRVETQVSREWLSAQRLVMENGEAFDVSALSWDELRPWLPELAREALSRHRHTDYSAKRARSRERPSSRLWSTIGASVDRWDAQLARREGYDSPREWRGVGELLSIARSTSEVRLTRTIESAAARLHLAAASRGEVVGPAELAWQVVDTAMRGEGVHKLEKLDDIRAEYARRMGWPVPRRISDGEGTVVRSKGRVAADLSVEDVQRAMPDGVEYPELFDYSPDESL